ncbi:MAG: CapA family protein [Bacteroidales bacterium]|nr:CapA family protein [Bacteroidales bacterium]
MIALALVSCGPRGGRTKATVGEQSLPELLPAPRPDTVTVRIIGDVMMHRGQIDAARFRAQTVDRTTAREFDFVPFLDSIAPALREADLAIAGMEFTLAGQPYTGYPAFSAPDSYADYVADCGVDVFLTANNHILDKGLAGLKRTLLCYDAMELDGRIQYTGCAFPEDTLRNPLLVRVKDQTIAIVNFTYGTNVYPELDHYILCRQDDSVLSLIAKARERGADFVLVCPHWGDEYVLTHNQRQEDWAVKLAQAGADAIVGAHPHVVQDAANITTTDGRKVPVYYSIGNAVSNMSAPNTQDELMVTLRISEGKLIDISHTWMHCYLPNQLTDSYTTVFI